MFASRFFRVHVVAIGILLFRRPPQPMSPRPTSVTVAAEDAWALGTVRAADGTPLAGARVTFTNAQGSRSTITDDDGNFRLHVPAGDHSISVEAAGERDWTSARRH